MASEFYVPQVDYRARDYASIRDDLLDLIPNFAPQWTSRDTTDFGVVLLELFSYMGDILNYYIDRAANEGFLATATQRETVLNLARVFGYVPAAPTPCVINILATNSSTVSSATIKPLARFSTEQVDANGNYVFFEYTGNSDVTIATNAATTIEVREGTTIATTQVAVSDGTPNQTYPLYNTDLVYAGEAFTVLVGSTAYTQTDNLIDFGPTDEKYSIYYDGNGVANIRFGDGVSGKIPPLNSTINVRYRKGLGSLGNVGVNTVKTFVSNGTAAVPTISISNPSADTVGTGTDPESMDSIRLNAPLSLRALNRAVSLSDYSALAIQANDRVLKANAIADNYQSIVIFVMGAAWDEITTGRLTQTKNYFVGKTPPGTRVTVLNGNVVYPGINVAVTAIPTATNSVVQDAVHDAIANLLSFDNVTFNDVIYQADVYKAVTAVGGVNTVNILGLDRRTTSTTAVATASNQSVYFQVNEVPKYNKDNITVTVTGGAA